MNKKIISGLVMTLFIATFLMTTSFVSACTTFMSSDNENVLVGSTMDWYVTLIAICTFFLRKKGNMAV